MQAPGPTQARVVPFEHVELEQAIGAEINAKAKLHIVLGVANCLICEIRSFAAMPLDSGKMSVKHEDHSKLPLQPRRWLTIAE